MQIRVLTVTGGTKGLMQVFKGKADRMGLSVETHSCMSTQKWRIHLSLDAAAGQVQP